MSSIRAFFLNHRALAAMLVVAALCLRAVVPNGYMVGQGERVLTVQICDQSGSHTASQQIAIPMKPGSDKGDNPAKWQGECAYSSLSMASLAGADPLLLALAIAFILALGFAPVTACVRRHIPHLRPHLRGPPGLV